jgi:hypothetical protein
MFVAVWAWLAPRLVPVVLAVVLVAVAVGGFFLLRSAWRAEGAAAARAEQLEEQAKRDKADRAAAEAELTKRDQAIAELKASAEAAKKEIENAPVTSTCGPAVGRALDWLRKGTDSGH